MATIVLVHGIAHEQLSADTLESQWLPALAGGVRNSGDAALADRLWRHGKPGDIDVRMAYYGNKYLKEGAQGTDQTSHLEAAALDLAEQLAETWLRTAAQYADDDRDQREAANQLRALERDDDGAQGTKAAPPDRSQRDFGRALQRRPGRRASPPTPRPRRPVRHTTGRAANCNGQYPRPRSLTVSSSLLRRCSIRASAGATPACRGVTRGPRPGNRSVA